MKPEEKPSREVAQQWAARLLTRHPVQGVLLASLLALLGIANNINWGGEHWRSVLQADAKGYYAYLPAVFIHGDLHFGFMEEAEATGSNPNLHYDFRVNTPGGTVNKYWCGTAVLQMPFHLSARLWEWRTGEVTNGYGKPFIVAIGLAAIFYAWVGLWSTARVLGHFNVQPSAQALVLVVLLFGTHLFYYVIVAPGMSHVYSFALISLFCWCSLCYFQKPSACAVLAMGVLLGLILLVRPVNGIIVLALPFLAGSWQAFWSGLQSLARHKSAAAGSALVAIGIFLVQPFLYFINTGTWWVDSYPGEHFNWTDPHPLDFLFSYKKGFFLYTPVCVIACVGLIHLGRRSHYALITWAIFLVILVYVLSSWWNWWYGGSFSARPMVEYLSFFALPMGMALQQLRGAAKRGYVTGLFLLVSLRQVQTYQARYYRIHYENMDSARYWKEFLRLDKLP